MVKPAWVASGAAVLLVLVVGALPAKAETYYISEDGSDDNPGSQESPFATFERANAAVEPGDTVIVEDGHYNVGLYGFVTRKSGTEEHPITWQAEHVGQVFVTNREPVTDFAPAEGTSFGAEVPEKPLLLLSDEDMLFPARAEDEVGPKWQPGTWRYADGRVYVWLWDSDSPDEHKIRASYGNIINLTGDASYQVWDGLVFEYGLCGWKTHYNECCFNTVRNCTFRYVGQGILGAQDALIEHCHFERIGCTHWEHGIYCGAENTVIRYCTFRDIAGGALHLYPEPRNITAYGNVIGPPQTRHHTWGGTCGIYAWGRGGHKLYRNVIYGGHGTGISLNADECLVANNTIVGVKGTAVYLYDHVRNTIRNNALGAGEAYLWSGQPDNDLDHNCYVDLGAVVSWVWAGKPLTDFAAYRQASGQEAHPLRASPAIFAHSAQHDFRPAPDSLLVDAGAAIAEATAAVQGDAPDIGAFELGVDWPEKPGPVAR